MISKQASTLPRRLLRRYGTSDPFELADCLGITILECHDFKLQKGAFKVILNNCFIFINANLSTEMKKLVCAHELGHALLHRPLGKTDTGLMEFELFDITNTTEYEANLFAANLRKLFIQVYSRNALSKPYIKQFLSEVNPSDLQFIWTRIFNHLNHLPAQLFDLV